MGNRNYVTHLEAVHEDAGRSSQCWHSFFNEGNARCLGNEVGADRNAPFLELADGLTGLLADVVAGQRCLAHRVWPSGGVTETVGRRRRPQWAQATVRFGGFLGAEL